MAFRLLIFCAILLVRTGAFSQTHTLTGTIIDAQFYPVNNVGIFNIDTVLLTTSDYHGKFIVSVPIGTKYLIIASVGMEWKKLELTDSCNNLDIVLLPNGTY